MDLILTTLGEVTDPARVLVLLIGVLAGLFIGVVPGLSGIFGMALLVPFTYTMDPFAAVALLLGLGAVTTTSDTVPAVILGVPGTVGAMATTIDGHAMAKNGEASRALGAAYGASLVGGLVGAMALAIAIPLLGPVVLLMRTPDFLATGCLGLGAVALIVGGSPLKGLSAAFFGMLVAMIGLENASGSQRWTFDQLYLWDGLPIAVVFLGLFGLPELAVLLTRGRIVATESVVGKSGLFSGLRDVAREWRLVLQGSGLGALVGAVPGIGLSIVGWIAYGLATRFRGGGPDYGDGNVRGVIAPESAANATEGGGLIPTVALGLPSGATMAIVLGALIVQGLTPGPSMLTDQASVTLSMVMFLALANVFGTLVCLGATPALARIALIPASALVPVALCFVVIGAYQTQASVGDLITLMIFGAVGWVMRAQNWPRPAFALGFVLGPLLEHYTFLSWQIHGANLLLRPSLVVVLLALLVLLFVQLRRARRAGPALRPKSTIGATSTRVSPRIERITAGAMIILSVAMLATSATMPFGAALFPRIAAFGLTICCAIYLYSLIGKPTTDADRDVAAWKGMGLVFGLALIYCLGLYAIGALPAATLLIVTVMKLRGKSSWRNSLLTAAGAALVLHLVYDRLVHVAWPQTWLF